MSRTLWVFALVDLVLSAFSNVLEEHEIDRGMHRWYHDWVPAFAWIQEWRHPTMKSATELEIEREESEVVEDYFDDEVAKKEEGDVGALSNASELEAKAEIKEAVFDDVGPTMQR